MKIKFEKPGSESSAIVTFAFENGVLSESASALNKSTGGVVAKAAKSGKFKGKKGQFTYIQSPSGTKADLIVVSGIGNPGEINAYKAQCIGGAITGYLNNLGVKQASILVDEEWKGCKVKSAELAANLAYGSALRSYRFDKYRTKLTDDEKPSLESISFVTSKPADAEKAFKPLKAIADSVFFTRDLVSEPANVIYPESYANICKGLTKLGVDVEILGVKEMTKLGMGALLGVGQGSDFESKMVIMRWNGNPSDKNGPLAFVGKGVTFDTGGISIKPANGMEEMKWDMAGSAVVAGLIRALAERKAKVNAVGVIGLVENMPSGKAQRPGDVVKSMSGQTIEVINTDAEGRLVLADALWYTQSKYKPRFMVNLATLTGAIIVSLGSIRAGLFSNNDDLSEKLFKAGEVTGEELWRLPLGEAYDKQINSDIADMKNVGEGREAGSITAAQFLQRFVNNVPWAHLDIAGVEWFKKDHDVCPKGASAFGLRLLEKFVADNYEGK